MTLSVKKHVGAVFYPSGLWEDTAAPFARVGIEGFIPRRTQFLEKKKKKPSAACMIVALRKLALTF